MGWYTDPNAYKAMLDAATRSGASATDAAMQSAKMRSDAVGNIFKDYVALQRQEKLDAQNNMLFQMKVDEAKRAEQEADALKSFYANMQKPAQAAGGIVTDSMNTKDGLAAIKNMEFTPDDEVNMQRAKILAGGSSDGYNVDTLRKLGFGPTADKLERQQKLSQVADIAANTPAYQESTYEKAKRAAGANPSLKVGEYLMTLQAADEKEKREQRAKMLETNPDIVKEENEIGKLRTQLGKASNDVLQVGKEKSTFKPYEYKGTNSNKNYNEQLIDALKPLDKEGWFLGWDISDSAKSDAASYIMKSGALDKLSELKISEKAAGDILTEAISAARLSDAGNDLNTFDEDAFRDKFDELTTGDKKFAEKERVYSPEELAIQKEIDRRTAALEVMKAKASNTGLSREDLFKKEFKDDLYGLIRPGKDSTTGTTGGKTTGTGKSSDGNTYVSDNVEGVPKSLTSSEGITTNTYEDPKGSGNWAIAGGVGITKLMGEKVKNTKTGDMDNKFDVYAKASGLSDEQIKLAHTDPAKLNITEEQAHALTQMMYGEKRNTLDNLLAKDGSNVSKLSPEMQEIAGQMIYRGDLVRNEDSYKGKLYDYVKNDDVAGLKKYISDNKDTLPKPVLTRMAKVEEFKGQTPTTSGKYMTEAEKKAYLDNAVGNNSSTSNKIQQLRQSNTAPTEEVKQLFQQLEKDEYKQHANAIKASMKMGGIAPMSEKTKNEWRVLGKILKDSGTKSYSVLKDVYDTYQNVIGKPFSKFIQEYAPGGNRL